MCRRNNNKDRRQLTVKSQDKGGFTLPNFGSFPSFNPDSIFKSKDQKKSSGPIQNGVVFVAGATGRVGYRVVRELLLAGFKVRAGVRNVEKAQEMFNTASEEFSDLTRQQLSRLDIVSFDITDKESIPPAIGNSTRIVCAVGAAESEFTDLTAPKKIDGEGTINLIQAAVEIGRTDQFVLVTSLGTGKFGWPAGILNLFGGVLIFKRQAEKALEASGLRYVIVRPGGMERPTDEYKLTHNVKILPRDSIFGGQVSRLQIAELVAAAVANPELAENKCLEVVAESTAPLMQYEDLLNGALCEEPQAARSARLEQRQDLLSQLLSAQQELREAEDRLGELKDQMPSLQSNAAEAKAREAAVRKENMTIIKDAELAEARIASLERDVEEAAKRAEAAKAVTMAAQRAQRDAQVLTSREIGIIRDNVLNPPRTAAAAAVAADPNEGSEEDVDNGRGKQNGLFSSFGSLFGKERSQAPQWEEEVEEEEEEVVSAGDTSSSKASIGSLFGGFFNQSEPTVVEEAVEEEEDVEAPAETETAVERAQKPAFEMPSFFRGALDNMQSAADGFSQRIDSLRDEEEPSSPSLVGEKGSEVDAAPEEADEVTESQVPENVQDAREWISKWRARSQ